MRKILIVGFVPYGYDKKLSEKNPDVIFFEERSISHNGVNSIIELVDMMNGILFMSENGDERLAWEVACVMKNKRIFETSDFPIEDEKESEGDDAN